VFSDKCYYNYDASTINAIYPALLINEACQESLSDERLFELAEFDPAIFYAADSRISLRQFVRLVDVALVATGSANLGFRYGNRFGVTTAGLVSTIMMSSATLGDALNCAMQYYPVNGIIMDMSFTRRGEFVHAHCPSLFQLSPQVQRFMMESWLSAWLGHISFLVQRRMNFSEVHLIYDRPRNADLYDAVFGCKTYFGSDRNGVVFPLEYLKEKLPTADDIVWRISTCQCKSRLEEVLRHESIAVRVAELLLGWEGDYPSADEMANMLKMSQRSMAKKLSDSGTSYQRILNDARRQKAIDYIQRGDIPVAKIAEKLGFSDSSNFRKAFRNWSGATPSAFRRHQVR
jgi:AraC-like DNA-binding protein